MTRSELIRIVSDNQSQLSEKQVEMAIKCIFDLMTDALGKGQRIEIRRFGSFSVRYRPARTARNPKTGAYINKKAKYSLHFKPGKEMRERVNSCFLQQQTEK
jgi:integration host factor subunit beta